MNLPKSINLDKLINNLKFVCWEASDILVNYSQKIADEQYENQFIKYKEINEPVTLADIEVNNLILRFFKENYPNVDWFVLSEENNKEDLKFKIDKDWIWVLDPLDGTKDFIQNTGNFAMHLSLNYKNKPYLGFVLIPLKDQLWITNGKSVWSENRIGLKTKTKLSDRREIHNMKLVTSKNHKNKMLNNIIKLVGFKESITMGSIGCKITSILRGESDVYISLSLPGQSSPKDWDFAAPEALLRSAGGIITNLENEELNYNNPNFEQRGFIIASNHKGNHENICNQIKLILEENKITI